MKFKNIGMADRILRLVVGAAIVVAGIVFQNWLGLIGLIPILTAVVGICPAYLPFRFTTAKKEG